MREGAIGVVIGADTFAVGRGFKRWLAMLLISPSPPSCKLGRCNAKGEMSRGKELATLFHNVAA